MSDIRLNEKNSILIVVDVQEKLFNAVADKNNLKNNLTRLVKAFSILDIPIVFLEQNPKGLGSTIKELNAPKYSDRIFQKTTFGVYSHSGLLSYLKEKHIKNVLLCGIESHVCVLQTGMDLISQKFNIHLLTDAVSSRTQSNCKTGIKRLIQEGALYSSVETALFDILKDCNHKKFKCILELVK